jgi:two-component system, cell cycle response regulator
MNNQQEKPATILLVEDNKFLRKAAEAALRGRGFTVLTATDGEEALKLAQSVHNAPDLVLLDIVMPKLNGFDVLRLLKGDPVTSHIPVIVLSNLEQQNDILTARELGAAGYWVKATVGLDELVERVQTLLAEQASHEAGHEMTRE